METSGIGAGGAASSVGGNNGSGGGQSHANVGTNAGFGAQETRTAFVPDPNIQDTQSNGPKDQPGGNGPKPINRPQQERLYDVVVDGQITERITAEEMHRRVQKAHAADKRLKEATDMSRKAKAFQEAFARDPIGAIASHLKSSGKSDEEIRGIIDQAYYQRFLEPEQLTPEQRENRELKAKLKEREEQEQARQKEIHERRIAMKKEAFTKSFTSQVLGLLQQAQESEFPLPATEEIVNAIATYMIGDARAGTLDIPGRFQQIQKQVWNDYTQHFNTLLSKMEGESLLKFLGDGIANKVRKADLARLRSGEIQTRPAEPPADGNAPHDGLGTTGTPKERLSYNEMRRKNRFAVTSEF